MLFSLHNHAPHQRPTRGSGLCAVCIDCPGMHGPDSDYACPCCFNRFSIELVYVVDEPEYWVQLQLRDSDHRAMAYVGLGRVTRQSEWPIALDAHALITSVDEIDHDTPVYAVDEATQAEWLANHGTIGYYVNEE